MADLYPGIGFPKVDFSILGDLPATYEEARGARALRESLSGLKSSDPKSLRDAAAKAFATGTQKGVEAGTRLYAAAQAQENLAQKAQADQLYLQALPGLRTPGSAPAAPETIDIPLGKPAAPAAPAPAAPAPTLFLQSGQVPGPQSAVETAPPYQTAGPPMPPPTFPPPPPTQGASDVTQAPPGLPIPAAPAPSPAQVAPAVAQPAAASPYDQARQEAMMAGNELLKLGPRATNTPAGRAFMSQFTSALNRAKLPEKEISYQQELLRRAQENQERIANGQTPLPELTRQDFANDAATVKERYAATQKLLTDYQDAYRGGKAMGAKLEEVKNIISNPRFAPGEPGYADYIRNRIGAISDIFRGMGVPEALLPSRETLKGITEPVALREAFESTMKQALTAYISNRAFSDADRNALLASLPNLSMTREGMELAIGILDRAQRQATTEYRAASKYASEKETRATSVGMQEAVDRASPKDTIQPPKARTYPKEFEGRTATGPNGQKMIVKDGELVPVK